MFTVCPKCALTLVVTAADLRVAQGYVRCGRCSNVFNALARLSEDREAAAAAAQTQAATQHTSPQPAQPMQQAPADTALETSARAGIQTSERESTSGGRPDFQPLTSASTMRLQQLADAPPDPIPSDSVSSEPGAPESLARVADAPPPAPSSTGPTARRTEHEGSSGDEDIPDDALEFNPAATDVTKVFVEQAPSREFQAATGTFQALRLEAEEARAQEQRAREDGEAHSTVDLGPVDTQVDVEIDPELLATMAQLGSGPARETDAKGTSARAPTSDPTSQAAADSGISATSAAQRTAGASPAQRQPGSTGTGAAGSAGAPTRPPTSVVTALSPVNPTSGVKPAPPPPSQAADSAAAAVSSTPMAARARARAEAARPSLETTQAIRSMLVRKRPPTPDSGAEQVASAGALHERLWVAGSALMALLLLVQVIHHYRNDLAANSHLNRPMTALYSAFGVRLIPRWNLAAYEVRQLGASTAPDAPGQITVRASVKNDADQSQPMPLLRVTLQDRFGNRIAARDVPPRAYLPGAAQGRAVLSAGQRVDAEMAFVDPGANAVGFEIDACLPAPGGVIACANDTLSR